MEILAIDQHLEAPDENKMDPKQVKSVTLLVTPQQAAKLGLATSRGILQLSLRRPEDHSDADTLPATMADLRFDQERPLPPLENGQSSPSGINRILGSIATVVSRALNATKDMDFTSSVGGPPRRIAQIHTIRGSHRGSIQIMENRRSARVNSR
jgi:Flp pilus assembly protein CpaB